MNPEIESRFWFYVAKSSECWEWTAFRTSKGYGRMTVNRQVWRAHRLSWIIHFGFIPDGMHVLHKCDNPSCVRPDHLFIGTNKDNNDDKMQKGRHRAPTGPDHGRSKLTLVQVNQIRELWTLEVMSAKELAAKFEIGPSHVRNIIHRKKWKAY